METLVQLTWNQLEHYKLVIFWTLWYTYPYFQLSGKLLLKSLTEIKDCTATCTVHVTMPSCTLNFIKKDFPLILFFAIRHKGIYCLKIKWFSRGGIYWSLFEFEFGLGLLVSDIKKRTISVSYLEFFTVHTYVEHWNTYLHCKCLQTNDR